MRCDKAPWNNKLVRQAMALSLNRPEIAQALFKGYAQLGNDNPFAPIFRSTDTSVPQRAQDLTKAKQLLSQAGHPNGFTTDLYTEDYQEMKNYAQIIKQAGTGHRYQHQPARRQPGHVLQGPLAVGHHEPRRLRPSRSAERRA